MPPLLVKLEHTISLMPKSNDTKLRKKFSKYPTIKIESRKTDAFLNILKILSSSVQSIPIEKRELIPILYLESQLYFKLYTHSINLHAIIK